MTEPTPETTTELDHAAETITRQHITLKYGIDWKLTVARSRHDRAGHYDTVHCRFAREKTAGDDWQQWTGQVFAYGVRLLKNGKDGKQDTQLRLWSSSYGLTDDLPEQITELVARAQARRDELADTLPS